MLPEDELWQLCRAAYEQYQSEIQNSDKAYSRYVNDFFSYHLPIVGLAEDAVRRHFMNLCSLKELLEERQDLVDVFFNKERFDKDDFNLMFHLFNTGKNLVPETIHLATFQVEQIQLITEFINHVDLFTRKVTHKEIADLFSCELSYPLQAANNRHVALFFGTLRYYGLIPFSWQLIMEEHKLISSSATNKPILAHQLRCGLSQAKNAGLGKGKHSCQKDEVGFETVCKDFVLRLKSSL